MRRELRRHIVGIFRSGSFMPSAVALLALGLGISIAAFSLVEAVLMKPLPYKRSDALVTIRMTDDRGATLGASYRELEKLKGTLSHSKIRAFISKTVVYPAQRSTMRMNRNLFKVRLSPPISFRSWVRSTSFRSQSFYQDRQCDLSRHGNTLRYESPGIIISPQSLCEIRKASRQ